MSKKYDVDKIRELLRTYAYPFSISIAPVYKQLGWIWGEETEPPTADEIKNALNELIDHLDRDDGIDCTVSSGGLVIGYDILDEGKTLELIMKFEYAVGAFIDMKTLKIERKNNNE